MTKLFRDLMDVFWDLIDLFWGLIEPLPASSKSAERQSKYLDLKKLGELPPPSRLDPDYKGFLVEAYKKHSTELASIEDRLNKLLLIILGVFGAGATAISKAKLATGPAGALIFLVVVFAYFGVHYVFEIHQVKAAVRYLLVRCEIDMGFYFPNDRTKDIPRYIKQLYTDEELEYPTKGEFLRNTYAAVIILAALGLVLLIFQAAGGSKDFV